MKLHRRKVFPKGGCLIFFGDIFGGRYGENYHRIINYEYDKTQGLYRFHFNAGETCTIYEPKDISYSNKAFVILDASRIVWEWYYYDREKSNENLNRWEFEKIDACFVAKTEHGNLGVGKTTFEIKSYPALQFV